MRTTGPARRPSWTRVMFDLPEPNFDRGCGKMRRCQDSLRHTLRPGGRWQSLCSHSDSTRRGWQYSGRCSLNPAQTGNVSAKSQASRRTPPGATRRHSKPVACSALTVKVLFDADAPASATPSMSTSCAATLQNSRRTSPSVDLHTRGRTSSLADTPRPFRVSDMRLRHDHVMTAKRGRPSKGDRDLLVTRPAAVLGKAVRASAEREGFESLSAYIAAVLAEHEGMAQYAPRPLPRSLSRQEALQISA